MELQQDDLDDFTRGAAILGTGGGGDPYIGRLMLQQAMEEGGDVQILDLQDIADDALVVPFAMMGTPTVLVEKLPNGSEAIDCLRKVEECLGRKVDAVIPAEIGGFNAAIPVVVAARAGLPVIDGDGMGRAFPELQMVTYSVYGCKATPLVMTNEHGDSVVIESESNHKAEMLARSLVMQMGGSAQICCYPMDGKTAKRVAIPGTLTLAREIGRAVARGRKDGDPVEALLKFLATTDYYRHNKVLLDGKIIDLVRETRQGFAIGKAILASLDDSDSQLEITFQNENLVARLDGQTKAIVPDLICVLDRETAEPITTEGLRYGQRVKVIGASVPPVMRTPEALDCFGPKGFGIDEPFQPIEELI